jgi:hypothetical protein
MKEFEKLLLAALPGLLALAEAAAPLVIHSPAATLVLNASEAFAGAALQQFATPAPIAVQGAPAQLHPSGITVVPAAN